MSEYPVFQFTVANAKPVNLAFAGLARAVKDWRATIWPMVVAQAIKPHIKAQFESEGGSGSHGAWPALLEPYATRKAKKFGSKPKLEATGKMKRDILSDQNRGELEPLRMRFGSSTEYAIYHQTGTRKMRARRIIDPGEAFTTAARRAVTRAVAHECRKRGFAVAGSDITAGEAMSIGRGILGSSL